MLVGWLVRPTARGEPWSRCTWAGGGMVVASMPSRPYSAVVGVAVQPAPAIPPCYSQRVNPEEEQTARQDSVERCQGRMWLCLPRL